MIEGHRKLLLLVSDVPVIGTGIFATIESEGPDEWWKGKRQAPSRNGKLNY